jgi:uncharacterized protein YecT (DUF1311 family)
MDMTSSTFHALSVCVALAAPAAAATPDCTNPKTQADLNACAYEDWLAANAAQVSAMKAYETRLGQADRQRWRAAQKAWIGWRTAQCSFESGAVTGGSAREMLRWQCTAKLTRERTVAIERLASCPEGDLACPARRP